MVGYRYRRYHHSGHRDCGDTYNGQFFTSGPLIDGVLGTKAYGSLAKRERMTRKTQRPPIPEKRRVLKDSPAATAMSNLPGHRIKITILLPDTVSTVRTLAGRKPPGTPELLRQP
ncbi:hypothetical protein ACNKHP_03595 [Shigella boydii]